MLIFVLARDSLLFLYSLFRSEESHNSNDYHLRPSQEIKVFLQSLRSTKSKDIIYRARQILKMDEKFRVVIFGSSNDSENYLEARNSIASLNRIKQVMHKCKLQNGDIDINFIKSNLEEIKVKGKIK